MAPRLQSACLRLIRRLGTPKSSLVAPSQENAAVLFPIRLFLEPSSNCELPFTRAFTRIVEPAKPCKLSCRVDNQRVSDVVAGKAWREPFKSQGFGSTFPGSYGSGSNSLTWRRYLRTEVAKEVAVEHLGGELKGRRGLNDVHTSSMFPDWTLKD